MDVDAAVVTPSLTQAAPLAAVSGPGVSSAALGSAATPPFFPVGSSVVIHGLASRTDLEGKIAVVIVAQSAVEDRVAVRLPNGEQARVKYQNIWPSLFASGAG